MDVLDQTLEQGQQDKDKDLDEEVTVHLHADGDQVVTDPSGEGPFAENIQYQFRTDSNGQSQVTYRVVQVGDNDANPQAVVTTFPQGQQALTQVIQGSFNGESPTSESQGGETRFTYFPASAGISGDGAATGAATAAEQPGIAQSTGSAGGQFYVMMSPQDVLQGASQRTIAPRTHQFNQKVDNARTVRDERRRATHNEVERRRRDKINNWIVKLSKIIPDCNIDHSKQGQSKGGILSKTCDYIQELRNSNTRMAESLKETERLSVDVELMRQQLEEMKGENALLRAQLQQAGIEPAGGSN